MKRQHLPGIGLLLGITLLLGNGQGTTAWAAKAKKRFSWMAVSRLRYESQNNFNAKFYGDQPKQGEASDKFLLGRFRLGFHYRPQKNVHFKVSTQHSEAWNLALKGDDFYKAPFEQHHSPYRDHWDLHETFV